MVSGGTGAGKTTLLNVLSGFISPRERIVTIEDSAELRLKQEHVVRLECRPPNVEGNGGVRQRELLINALRMRPDRIIVGEVRGEEALDMLQAMNTGHDGSITTVHANSPRDAIARIETMALMANLNLPEMALRQQIAAAVHLIVQVSRMSDGSRRVTHISEITGTSDQVISMQDIFLFQKLGLGPNGKVLGRFYATGIVPKFAEKLQAAGIAAGNQPARFLGGGVGHARALQRTIANNIAASPQLTSADGSRAAMFLIGFIFVVVLLLSFGVVLLMTRPTKAERVIEERIAKLSGRQTGAAGLRDEAAEIIKPTRLSELPWLDAVLQDFRPAQSLQLLIAQAGKPVECWRRPGRLRNAGRRRLCGSAVTSSAQ